MNLRRSLDVFALALCLQAGASRLLAQNPCFSGVVVAGDVAYQCVILPSIGNGDVVDMDDLPTFVVTFYTTTPNLSALLVRWHFKTNLNTPEVHPTADSGWYMIENPTTPSGHVYTCGFRMPYGWDPTTSTVTFDIQDFVFTAAQ